ncbi:nucleotidyltransferase family protein [Hydrogenophaga defluvii]|uniref:Nucleotidyltransferase family protein n=1 Tax=Hydrogenophaga defluvii TaxID=249410 RepID=A0ABW2SDB1_9BURK
MDEARRQQLVALVRQSPALMRALSAGRSLGLPSWCIGAGVVRNLVWDHLHGRGLATPCDDLDLVYFDANDLSPATEARLRERLSSCCPGPVWDVTNQAAVHLWYAAKFGQEVEPLPSLVAGLATWPEVATAVGVCLTPQDQIDVLAPFGLDDLFNMHVRHNPARASVEAYRQRVRAKRFGQRWPGVVVFDAEN